MSAHFEVHETITWTYGISSPREYVEKNIDPYSSKRQIVVNQTATTG